MAAAVQEQIEGEQIAVKRCGILGILVTAGGLKLLQKVKALYFNSGSVLFPQIEFINEIRSVGYGVKSEFFYIIFEEMTKTEYGMFMYPEEGSYMWFPISVSLLFIFLFFFQNRKIMPSITT